MIYPHPIPTPWPVTLATLALGAAIGGIGALMLSDDEEEEALCAEAPPDLREKLAVLATMRDAEDISPDEYKEMRKMVLEAFAHQ